MHHKFYYWNGKELTCLFYDKLEVEGHRVVKPEEADNR